MSTTGRTPAPEPTATTDGATEGRVDVGLLVAHSERGDPGELRSFARGLAEDVSTELDRATTVPWRFYDVEPEPVATGDRLHRPSEFLDDAVRRMVAGPYDVLVVLTDVPLTSRRERIVPGLASPLSRVAVVSTHGLGREHRACAGDSLDGAAMRWNGATLLLHLLGHVLGVGHDAGAEGESAMAPFRFDPSRRSVPAFDADVRRELERVAADIPQADAGRGRLSHLLFHLWSAARNPRVIGEALVGSRAPLLPLSLPRLSTAALAPALILVFSAETWDVGIHISDGSAVSFAVVSAVAAAVHLLFVHDLLFPRRSGPRLTEHVALVNVTVALIALLSMAGLFALVGLVTLGIELAVFPPDLMTDWPSLEDPAVGLLDIVRTAGFIATVGMLSGALGGGLENRAVVRHLALFLDRP